MERAYLGRNRGPAASRRRGVRDARTRGGGLGCVLALMGLREARFVVRRRPMLRERADLRSGREPRDALEPVHDTGDLAHGSVAESKPEVGAELGVLRNGWERAVADLEPAFQLGRRGQADRYAGRGGAAGIWFP